MRVCCYFAYAEGAHPLAGRGDYDALIPVMSKFVHRHGYKLDHLTCGDEPAFGDRCIRHADLDPRFVMWNREVAWLRYLQELPEGEQAVLVEPDCLLLRKIPPLTDADLMLLQRDGETPSPGFRLAKRSSLPLYEEVVRVYSEMGDDLRVIHGDVIALRVALDAKRSVVPSQWRGLRIEVRKFFDYCGKPHLLHSGTVALNFKGGSKQRMVRFVKDFL